MTSKGNTECFVYITLPGEIESVTAGRFELTKDRRGNALGRFVYGKSYLARGNAVAIDPIELKLSGDTYETARLNGVFGALRDAGPDYWGRRVIEKHAGAAQLGELDYLLNSADDRAGALGFGLNQQPPVDAVAFIFHGRILFHVRRWPRLHGWRPRELRIPPSRSTRWPGQAGRRPAASHSGPIRPCSA